MSRNHWAVLLAGGDGVRLQDLTRRITGDSRPKQFCCITGGSSLTRQTRARLQPLFQRDRQVFVVSRAHEEYYREDLRNTEECCLIEQPANRGTGIAILLALVQILERDPDAIVSFFPCDHHYADDDSFRFTIKSGLASVERCPHSILIVGAQAEYPEIDYGWIEPGPGVLHAGPVPLRQVRRFWEKPTSVRARALFRSGCLWNTFVSAGRAATFLDLLSEFPEAVLSITRAVEKNNLDPAYRVLPPLDFSRDILEAQPHKLLVLKDGSSGWADLGSPARVLRTLARTGLSPEWFREADILSRFKETLGDEERCRPVMRSR